MEKDMEFTCGKCKFVWKASAVEKGAVGTPEQLQDYKDGYNCPNCNSTDISGIDL